MAPMVSEAKEWAKGYLVWLEPRRDELFGKDGSPSVAVEIIRETLGISETDGVYTFEAGQGILSTYGVAKYLVTEAEHDPYAFDLMRKIIAAHIRKGTAVPGEWQEAHAQIVEGSRTRPKRQGNRPHTGARDLIFKVMAAHLMDAFGLPFENQSRTRNAPVPSACKVIADAFQATLEQKIEPGAISRAINRLKV